MAKLSKNTIIKPTKDVYGKSKNAKWPIVLLLLLACLGVGFFGGWLGSKQQTKNSLSNTSTQQRVVSSESELISGIAKEVGQSVVSVNVTSTGTVQSIFGFSRNVEQQSAGTGFIINKEGIVVTNRHVIPNGVSKVSVTLSDGTELSEVEVIGKTNDGDTLDVAFLKIKDAKGKELVPAKLGDSAQVKVGDKVIAIGNALGQFQNTVTSGIISGYGRSVTAGNGSGSSEELVNLFQTDASINQGNSGGPLVNMNSEVIGINTAVAGDGAENIGFAIPINDVKGIISSVLEKGKLERPYLGVRYVSLNDEYAYTYNLDTKRGAYLAPGQDGQSPIIAGSPAEKAGLKEKDIITKVGDVAIDEKTNLTSALAKYQVGDEVELTIIRDGKEQKVKVTLEALPQQ